MNPTCENDDQFYHNRVLALMIGLEVSTESLSTAAFGCYVFHKFVHEIGLAALRQSNPVVYIAAILFLSGKVTEHVHTMATCIISAYDIAEMLGPSKPPEEEVR
jgi:hypothetical protein